VRNVCSFRRHAKPPASDALETPKSEVLKLAHECHAAGGPGIAASQAACSKGSERASHAIVTYFKGPLHRDQLSPNRSRASSKAPFWECRRLCQTCAVPQAISSCDLSRATEPERYSDPGMRAGSGNTPADDGGPPTALVHGLRHAVAGPSLGVDGAPAAEAVWRDRSPSHGPDDLSCLSASDIHRVDRGRHVV